MPGPGNYSSHGKFGKGVPSFTMGGKTKDLNKNDLPGPGQYDESTKLTKTHGGSLKFGSSKRQELVNNSTRELPGPGNYTSDSKFGKGVPSFTMGGKTKDLHKNDIPGPGQYDESTKLTKAQGGSLKFGSSKRQDIVNRSMTELPGPGNYSSDLGTIRESGPKYTFTGR